MEAIAQYSKIGQAARFLNFARFSSKTYCLVLISKVKVIM